MLYRASRRRKTCARQKGLSLIETLCTVTIIGTMTATALPRLSGVTSEARVSVLRGLEGTLHSASSLAHARCVVQSTCLFDRGRDDIVIGDDVVNLVRGYPAAGEPQGIERAVRLSGFRVRHDGDETVFTLASAPSTKACQVRYRAPDADGAPPRIDAFTDGC